MDAKTGAIVGLSIVVATSAMGVGAAWLSMNSRAPSQQRDTSPILQEPTPAPTPEPAPPPEPTPIERLAIQVVEEAVSPASFADWPTITTRSDEWGMLRRNPAGMFGQPACIQGMVLEIHQISPELSWMRIGLDRAGADVVSVTGYQVPPNVIADRRVEVCGRWTEPYTYESQAGWTITLPAMMSAFAERL